MSQYMTPVPAAVIAQVPIVAAAHEAFDVRVQGFPGDNGEQEFAINVYTDPETITPDDRRQKPYIQVKQTSYFFTADGAEDGEPQTTTTRY